MKNIKAVISDLDGTLLLSKSQIGAFSELVIKNLTKENKKFIIATGRSKNEIISLIKDLNSHVSFFITLNGARVYNNKWQLISSYDLHPKIVDEILDLRENKYKNIPHFLQKSEDSDERLYADDITKSAINDIFKKHELFKKHKYIANELKDVSITYHEVSNFRKIKNFNNIAKILLLHDEESQLIKYEAIILEKYRKEINVYLSTPNSLEIVSNKVSKGSALKDVLKSINIGLDESIAFGDGFNDVDMLENVKKGLLMGNANYRLKKMLSYLEVIGTNDNEAVAHYINDNILEVPT
ncbi:Pyridoxal phosphate phosphatase YigL [Borrelia miyamotoi]|uniref:Cof-type HAD-IIB family hydrolase n=1 Tax=Borrelia miyamotoi TaxID=47466 RepID=A0AAP8YSE6_9SPIR|nr:Cof-type HAD-IIB family hydrolase [Borrelia miyamotoi]AHH05350.1 Hydrolase (HAD superfamily) [Borrelia miyamotoi FR64b]ATQ15108.1 Cof-type HAD-IIB family hydrolase [Borrelia miyamotoi]ATQ16290.1 Cof-type HAD-IIB family hydrolase [Borrelia miyamotoi]ATQ17434.1 Cof-type HAD-IIB family hydrolase [Borrelia miyamotoi]ATQ18064.1 Cof-type HAD-IIB family hydrolase [Borrelia miyamotoi]